jgi:tetratricopeptide (TPR) repeat protein
VDTLLPTRRRRLFILAVLLITLMVGLSAIITLADNTVSTSVKVTNITALVLAVGTDITLIANLLQPKKRPSDEEVSNAFPALNTARTLFNDKQYEEAIDKATYVISELPRQGEAYFLRGQALHELGRFTSALENYNKALGLQPGLIFAYPQRATLFASMGEYESAISDMLRCVALLPDLPSQLLQLALAYFKTGQFELAEKWFKKVIEHPETDDKNKEMAKEYLLRLQGLHQLQNEIGDLNMQPKRQFRTHPNTEGSSC